MTIEQHNVSISEMSLYYEPGLDSLCDHFPVRDEFQTHASAVGPHNIECSRVIVGAVVDEPFHFFDIMTGNLLGNS